MPGGFNVLKMPVGSSALRVPNGSGASVTPAGSNTTGTPVESDARGTKITETLRALEHTSAADVQMQIKTAEGDTVTLSIHDETDQTAISYRYRSNGPDGKSSARLDVSQQSSSHQIQMQVDGSLSADELAAINRLVDKVERDVQGALATGSAVSLANLTDPTSAPTGDPTQNPIAAFQVDVQQSDTVEAVVLRLRQWVPSTDQVNAVPTDRSAAPAPVSLPGGDSATPATPAATSSLASANPTTAPAVSSSGASANRAASPLPAALPIGQSSDPAQALFDRVKSLLDLIETLFAPAKAA